MVEDRLRLRPTSGQYRSFAEYLCDAHSWYKHLPLVEGRRFVVFVAADAGVGRLVAGHGDEVSLVTPAEGAEFTEANPRLHYGWKTTKEYRSRFGYLDYSCWPEEDGTYSRDAGSAVVLPGRLVERCGFVLYPYVSPTFAEAVLWSVHAEAIAALQSGPAHPGRDEILELLEVAESQGHAWAALDESERDWVIRDGECEVPLPAQPSAALQQYLTLDNRITAMSASLRQREADKIWQALAALDEWLMQEGEASDGPRTR